MRTVKPHKRRRISLGSIPDGLHDDRAMQFALTALRQLEKARETHDCKDAFAALSRAQNSFGAMAVRVASMRGMPALSIRTALVKLRLGIDKATRALSNRCLVD